MHSPGPLFRSQIGFEEPEDLIRDLVKGFVLLRARRG
jgi:cystathionine beta-lyase/cystathionine gamma-synthase